MTRRIPWIALLLVALSCGLSRYEDYEAFDSAILLEDGKEGLVAFSGGRYRYEGGDFWGKGQRVFSFDEKVIARIEALSGNVLEVLRREEVPAPTIGGGGYTFTSTMGRFVVVARGRRQRPGGTEIEGYGWYLLHADTGAMEELDPERELRRWNLRGGGTPTFVHPSGVLLYEGERPESEGGGIECVLRYPGGRLEPIGPLREHRVKDGKLYCWFEGDSLRSVLDPLTLERRPISNRDYSELEFPAPAGRLHVPDHATHVEFGTGSREAYGSWPIPIDTSDLR